MLLACALALLASPTRAELARHHAPVIFQEANDPRKDLFAAFDYDGDWNGDNQAENIPNYPLIATVYFTVIETPTHFFIQYMPYHPLDWKATNGHENDTESVLVVVHKDGSDFGALQVMETRFHDVWYQYRSDNAVRDAADNIDGEIKLSATGRPLVYSQMVGHGLCGGYSPPDYSFPDLQLTCNHDEIPHINQTGVVYSPDVSPVQMPVVASGQAVNAGYNLVELYTSVWTHIHEIGPGKAFKSAIDYLGERCATLHCPTQFGGAWEGDEGTSPGEPWAQEGGKGVTAVGDQFFDPAYTMSKRLSFPGPYSLAYCFNPYLSIDDTCDAADAGEDAGDASMPDDSGQPAEDAGGQSDAGAPAADAGAPSTDAGEPSIAAHGAGCNSGGAAGALWLLAALATSRLLGAARRRGGAQAAAVGAAGGR